MARVWSLHGQHLDSSTFSGAGRTRDQSGEPLGTVEVRVSWGDDLLEVRHLAAGRSFRVGEHDTAPIDFVAPELKLGGHAITLLDYDASGPALHVPSNARCSSEPVDGRVTLREGEPVRIEFTDLSFEFRLVPTAGRMPRAVFAGDDRSAPLYFGLSALTAGAVALGLSLAVPPESLLDDELLERERLITLQQYLSAQAERQRPPPEAETNADSGPSGGEIAAAARGESGKMGKLNAAANDRRVAFKGESQKVVLSREEALAEARSTGIIGLLSAINAAHPLTAPWGAEPEGMDSLDAMGNLWARELGEAQGSGGLALTGVGDGGGGDATDSIGLSSVGTCSTGVCSGLEHGFGSSHARASQAHVTRAPRIRQGDTAVSGTLAPEVVQRIVRQNFGRFRMCYERGLQQNPNLEGRVSVNFVIDRGGAVANASNSGSDLPDADVVQCVVRAYYGLSFPSPENGIVTVRYPIMFSPG